MRKTTSFLCMALAVFLTTCSPDDENKENTKDLIGDFSHYLVAKTSKGDFIAGMPQNVTEDNITHSMGISISGGACDHDFGTGFHPYHDQSLPAGSVYFAKMHDGHCAGYEENSRFHTFFDPGAYEFGHRQKKGLFIHLSFNFESDVYYTTEGVEQPESSYIRILESEPDNIDYGGYYNFGQLVTGEFRARLINPSDPDDVLEVSSGRFKLRVESYYEGRLD
jgi:hypothetical protein